MSSDNKPRKPKLEYPEDGRLGDREKFYDDVVALLEPGTWCTALINPHEFDRARSRIESDCHNLLEAVELTYKRLAWIVPFEDVRSVLSGLFGALKPELILMAFDYRPDVSDIEKALESSDAYPASKLLLFQDGELYEVAGRII